MEFVSFHRWSLVGRCGPFCCSGCCQITLNGSAVACTNYRRWFQGPIQRKALIKVFPSFQAPCLQQLSTTIRGAINLRYWLAQGKLQLEVGPLQCVAGRRPEG